MQRTVAIVAFIALACVVGIQAHSHSYVNEADHLVHSFQPHPSLSDAKKLNAIHEAMKIDWHKSIYHGVDLHAGITRDSDVPQQIKLAYVPQGMAVSWATVNPYAGSSAPTVLYGTAPNNLAFTAQGPNGPTYGTLYFHTVLLQQLDPNYQYYYQVVGNPTVYSFVSARQVGDKDPFTVTMVGDMGLANSNNTMKQMNAVLNETDFYLHIGDLSYADDFILRLGDTYEGSWDKWQTEMVPITANAAYMTLPGNHECTCNEVTPFLCPAPQKNFTAYRNRVRMPSPESGGVDNLWYSFDYGQVHFIQISTETDFPDAPMGPNSYWGGGPFGDQLAWLENDLQQAYQNRKSGATPWIIVSGHRPLYTSHKVCKACVAAFEALFLQYGVDIYFAGHVHWYERMWPMANGTITQQNYINPTGVVHIVNGAGGNVEGLNSVDNKQPYTAFLDDTDFGYGQLYVANSTAVQWTYYRATDNSIADQLWITKEH